MTSPRPRLPAPFLFGVIVVGSSIGPAPLVAQVAPTAQAKPPGADVRAETVILSPFEVLSDTKGYFATNTLSGTRLNTKLEDLASSITVITKEQMADFAMLDIND